MSGELIRYNRGEISVAGKSDARRTMDAALARLRGPDNDRSQTMTNRDRVKQASPMLHSGCGEVIDVPRVCAVHDLDYVSRYIEAADGIFAYAQSFKINSSNAAQYRSGYDTRRIIPPDVGDDETCPLCGATGWCAVACGKCGAEVCYGRTTAQGYFHCRRSCRSHGPLHDSVRPMQGVTPLLVSRSGPYSSGK